jgi:fucose 4-O-acetylase-like acetyltransferase
MITTFRKWILQAFNLCLIEKSRYKWIDYLRGIAIILVVYHHAFLGMEDDGISVPSSVVNANMAAYSFRMPLFFIFSGIFTSLSIISKPVQKIIWKRFSVILYPYFIWTTLQITLQILFSAYTHSGTSYSDYLYIFYQPKAIGQFWYLPALFNSTLVFILVKTKLQPRIGFHLLLGIGLFLLAPFVNSISILSNWMRFYIFLVIGEILSIYILKKGIRDKLKNPLPFLCCIPVFILAQYCYFHYIGVKSLENTSANFGIDYSSFVFHEIGFLIISLVGCATFILLSFLIEKWNRFTWLRIIGFHSLYIYIMHVIVVASVRFFMMKALDINNYTTLLITTIAIGVIFPIVFYNLIGKKYLWFLFSTEKPPVSDTSTKQAVLTTAEVRLTPLQTNFSNISQ